MIVVAVLTLRFVPAGHISSNCESSDKAVGLDDLLQTLTISTTNATNRTTVKEARERKQRTIDMLRANTSNFLPQLMQEVYNIGYIEVTNKNVAARRTERLGLVFEALGAEARPLLPKLINEFNAGRSIGPCVVAFRHIGGGDCGLILVSALTNSNLRMRNASMSVISTFATNREVAAAAVPPLLLILKDDSAFSRAAAASALGYLRSQPDTVVPSLLNTAKHDSDFVVRTMAIKAIGHFGTNAVSVTPALEAIADADENTSVRRVASLAIRAINEGVLPNELR
jgi:hypothetical protein